MRSADEFNEVRQLIAAGMNDCAIKPAHWHTATDGARLAVPSASPDQNPRRLHGMRG